MTVHAELAARMPWTTPQPESWWEVTGVYPNNPGTFTDCLARVLPGFILDDPGSVLFEVLVYSSPFVVPASSITSATELMFVHAREPLTAYYMRDQASIDRALAEREESK